MTAEPPRAAGPAAQVDDGGPVPGQQAPADLQDLYLQLAEQVCARLRDNKRVRRSLPGWGRLSVDRQLPFLCLYRRPARGRDEGTHQLVTSEAAYLTCSSSRSRNPGLERLVQAVAETLSGVFGSFLLLEVWSGPPRPLAGPVSTSDLRPSFRVIAPPGEESVPLLQTVEGALSRVQLQGPKEARVQTLRGKWHPPGRSPLMSAEAAQRVRCHRLGLEVAPIYRDPHTGEVFPAVLRRLRRALSVALRKLFFEFAHRHTSHRPPHFHTLGRRALVKAVWTADRMLAQVADQFDLLLQVTPVNGEAAFAEFQRQAFSRRPRFHYRPLPAEPVVLKRQLFATPVERVEDPALAQIFREKLQELDRQITMLQERGTARFLPESVQLFGGVEDELHDLARQMLREISPRSREGDAAAAVGAQAFAARARQELAAFRRRLPGMDRKVEVRSDLAGLMVSRGNLLVSAGVRLAPERVEALVQHEVGTHVLTYLNGRAQPLRMLCSGLAGYDPLQEGLAVLAEYLVGGLSRPRLRPRAGRVVAARAMLDGGSFVEVFRLLTADHGFARGEAFAVAMRTFRGGGLTKDAAYLRGLQQILEYLGGGGDLQPLFVGKIAARHIPVVRELQWRGVLVQPPLLPRYLAQEAPRARLARLAAGATVRDLYRRGRR